MAIPEPAGDFAAQRVPHRALRELLDALRAEGLALDTLSMGMSADLEAAVARRRDDRARGHGDLRRARLSAALQIGSCAVFFTSSITA